MEQQTATSEILGVIASSPTDIQPVLDMVAANAARLCEATMLQIYRVDGERDAESSATMDQIPRAFDGLNPIEPCITSAEPLSTVRPIHIHDLRRGSGRIS